MSAYIGIVYDSSNEGTHGDFWYSHKQLIKRIEAENLKYDYLFMPGLEVIQRYILKVSGDNAFKMLSSYVNIFEAQPVNLNIFPAIDSDQNSDYCSNGLMVEEYKKTGSNPWGLYNVGTKITHSSSGFVVLCDQYRQTRRNAKEAHDMMYSFIKYRESAA